MLRQQTEKRGDRANFCLADFVQAKGADWIGGFAEQMVAPEWKAVKLPDGVDFAPASTRGSRASRRETNRLS